MTLVATDADGNSDIEPWTVTVTDVAEVSALAIDDIPDQSLSENLAFQVTPTYTGTPIGASGTLISVVA